MFVCQVEVDCLEYSELIDLEQEQECMIFHPPHQLLPLEFTKENIKY